MVSDLSAVAHLMLKYVVMLLRALKDANKTIVFAPLSPKGYYRRRESLCELKVNSSVWLQSLNSALFARRLFFRHPGLLFMGPV
jgi:hypothetical protein